WPRAWLHLRLGLALAGLAAQSAGLALENRRASRRLDLHRTPPGGVAPMLLQDLRFAVRMLWKKPGFTLMAIAVLAISIGANTAIFSIVQQVLLRPLPFGQPERIVRIHETNPRGPVTVSPPNFVDWQAQNRTFEFMAAFDEARMTLSGGATPERIRAAIVGAALFDVLGVRPQLGRTFSAEEAQAGGPRAVILSHGLWQRRFGGDPRVLGTTLTIDARNHVVVGVMPRDLTFPDGFELWLPLLLTPAQLRDSQRGAHYLDAIGRLKPGVGIEQAEADLAAIERQIANRNPNVQGHGIWLQPVFDSVVGEYRRPLWMLLGAVTFLLLIGCANISNLLLSRAAARRGEIAIRSALGAGRWRIVRQLLAESTILSIVGGCAGLLLAVWASRVMNTLLPADIPRAEGIGLNAPVLIFTTAVSILTGLLFGIVPALEASRANLVDSLKDVRRDGSGGARQRMRGTLVAVEVALALVLLAGAGLALRSFDRLTRIDTGFEPTGTLAIDVVVPEATYPDAAAIVRFYRNYLEALAMQPGVIAAGAVSTPPLARSGFGGTFTLIGRPEPPEEPRTAVRAATPGYLEAVHIPLHRGRLITAADTETAPQVAVISEAAARRYWPGEDPIGQRIRLHVSTYAAEGEREIVGVVGDVKAGRIESAAAPLVYVPHAQYPFEFMTILLRAEGEAMRLAPMVRTQLAALDPDVAVGAIRPGPALVEDAVAQPRFRMQLLTLFAASALALAALGLYGVMSTAVSQRRSEIGLRIALGAGRGEVIGLVLRQGMLPVAFGLAAGLAGAAAMTSVMRGLLFGIEPFDPMTFAAVSLLLAAVAAMACYVPARRAASVDPLVALRSE
ncbi:MAG TPA: ABC transporter permease, partial [Vicinamibacterales bacterium]|nr:ABC transporter permease [Vicinamibacterales bacterium]